MRDARLTGAGPSAARIAIVAALALGCVFQVVRSAAEARFIEDRPDLAARAWPGHPQVQLSLSMAEIGRRAGAGQPASPQSIERAMRAATRAPLAIEPFLIQGAVETAAGKPAEQLFVEAKRRDPRSAAARYFLAQYYLGTGRIAAGLAETAVLSRVVPGGGAALVPGLAQYARSPGAVANLRRVFAGNPALAEQVLVLLARDAANADLGMALAARAAAPGAPAPAWHGPLLGALVERGDYRRAYELWRRLSGVSGPRGALFNSEFTASTAPPPFNWALASGEFGVAEAISPDGLQIIYYGRANGEFASQTLLLEPGDYVLEMQVEREGDAAAASGLGWYVDCALGSRRLLALPLGGAPGAARPLAGRFTVPAACPAQRLRLIGTARDFSKSEQAKVRGLRLDKVTR